MTPECVRCGRQTRRRLTHYSIIRGAEKGRRFHLCREHSKDIDSLIDSGLGRPVAPKSTRARTWTMEDILQIPEEDRP